MRFLALDVYSNSEYNYDATNNGVSGSNNKHRLFIESDEGNYTLSNLKDLVETRKQKVAVVYVDSKSVGGETYFSLKPYEFDSNFDLIKSSKHFMAGGNFGWSSDSRVRRIMKYPLPIHDRVE